jgi:predicted transport protein
MAGVRRGTSLQGPRSPGQVPAILGVKWQPCAPMALFKIAAGLAVQVLPLAAHPGKEKGLQGLIEKNLAVLFGVRFVAPEFSTGQKHRGRIDTLGLDQDGSAVIVEYKLTHNDNVINQGLFYLDWLMDHRGDFELAARSVLGEVDVAWSAPRLILLAQSFSRYDQYAVNRISDQIELWTYTLYEGGLLQVEMLSSDEVPDPKAKSPSPLPSPPTKARVPKAEYDLAHHTKKMSPTTIALFELMRSSILDLGEDISERFMNQYVGYRRLKNFCEIVGLRSKLNVFIDGPISDRAGLCEDVSQIGHWGTGNRRASAETEDDVLALLPLIAQAYSLQS